MALRSLPRLWQLIYIAVDNLIWPIRAKVDLRREIVTCIQDSKVRRGFPFHCVRWPLEYSLLTPYSIHSCLPQELWAVTLKIFLHRGKCMKGKISPGMTLAEAMAAAEAIQGRLRTSIHRQEKYVDLVSRYTMHSATLLADRHHKQCTRL